MKTQPTFLIDLDKIIVHTLSDGRIMARYRHPYTPSKLGIPKWVSEVSDNAKTAQELLVATLLEMGGRL